MSDIVTNNEQEQPITPPAEITTPAPVEPAQTISDDEAAKEYLDWSQRRFEFHESGLHNFKTNEIHEKVFDVDRAYQDDTVFMNKYGPDPNFYKRIYSAKLAEIDKQERANSDFNFGANYMATVAKVTPEIDLELREQLKGLGIQRSILNDEKTFDRLARSMLYESYVKNLKGRELSDEFFHDERFLKQSPETQYALVELNAANNILNGSWKKPDMSSTAKGYEMSQEKYDIRESLRKGEMSDIDAVRELKRINFDYNEDGFWNNVFSGFGAFASEIVTGTDIVHNDASTIRNLRQRVNQEYDKMIAAEPSFINTLLSNVADANMQEAEFAQYNLGALAMAQADAESRVHQLDQISDMKAKKPALSLTYLMEKTESERATRALMFGAINVLSFMPIPVGSIAKGATAIGAAAARVVPKPKVLGDVISAGIAKVSTRYAEKRLAARKAAQETAESLATKEVAATVGEGVAKEVVKLTQRDVAMGALGSLAVNTIAESALQGAIEGVSAAQYTAASNEILEQDESLFQSFYKAAAQSFVDNLLVSVALGAPNAIYNLGTVAKSIATDVAKFESLKAQEAYIEKAVNSGATINQIDADKLEHKAVNLNVEGFQKDIDNDPAVLKELVQVFDDPQHPAKPLAERVINALKANNDSVSRKFNRASSSEAFIINPVELALLYRDHPNLERAIKRNRTVGDFTEQDLIDIAISKIMPLLESIAKNNGMFEPDFYKDVMDTNRKLNPVADQIEADITAKIALPENANKSFKNNETRNASRFFAPMLTNYILRFAEELKVSPLEFYNSLNLKFVAGNRVYNVADGSQTTIGEFISDNGETKIYIGDENVPETLMHELAHMHLDLLSRSNAQEHMAAMRAILYSYCQNKGIKVVDSVSDLTKEQWTELQELYAYGATFQLVTSFEAQLKQSDRFLELVEVATRVRLAREDREAAIASGDKAAAETPELTYDDLVNEYNLAGDELWDLKNGKYDYSDAELADIKEHGPKIDRLTPNGALKSDIDLVTMVGVGLYRHFGDCTSFHEFKDKFSKHYKEVYGTDYFSLITDPMLDPRPETVERNYKILKSFSFLNDIQRGSYTAKGFTDTFLDPIAGDLNALEGILGKKFIDETFAASDSLKRAILNKAHEVYMINRKTTVNNFERQKLLEKANSASFDVNFLEADKAYRDAKIKSDNLEIERSELNRSKRDVIDSLNVIKRATKENQAPDADSKFNLGGLSLDESAKLETVIGEAAAFLNKGEVQPPYNLAKAKALLNEYKTKLNVKLDNVKADIKKTKAEAKKALSKRNKAEKKIDEKVEKQMKFGSDVQKEISQDTKSVMVHVTKRHDKFKNIVTAKLTEIDVTAPMPLLSDIGNFAVRKLESIDDHLKNLRHNKVVFSEADLRDYDFSDDDIGKLYELGLVSDRPTTSYAQYIMSTDYTDIDPATVKPDRRIKDIIDFAKDPARFINDIVTSAHDPKFNEGLIDILEVRDEFNQIGVNQMLKVLGKLNETLITKFKSQVNRRSTASEIKNEARNLVYKLSMSTNPYQLVRKGEAYFRRGLKQLAKANKETNAVDLAMKYFTQAEVLFMASKHLREVKDKIDSKKSRLKKTLSKTARNKELGKHYDNDTFIVAKTIGYNMGIVQTKVAYDDIMAYRAAKGYMDMTDSEKFYAQLGENEPRLREIGKHTNAKNLANMSIQEAMAHLNKIDYLLDLSRNLNNLRNTQRKADINEIVEQFLTKINEYKAVKGIKDSDTKDVSDMGNSKGFKNKLKSVFNTVTMSTQRPSTIIATIEGETDMAKSKLYNAIYGPVMDAEQKLLAKLSDLTTNYVTPMYKTLKELSKKVKVDKPYIIEGVKVDANGVERRIKYAFGETGDIVNDVAVMLANMGTESNRQAMCRSLGITEDQLNTHIKRLTDMGVITDDLWMAVHDNIWVPYDEIYTDTAKTFNDVYHAMYTKETGITIVLPSGREIQGGYSPLTIARDMADTEIRDPLEGDNYAQANLPSKDGFTKDRTIHNMDMSFDIKDVFYNMKRQETFAHMAKPCVEAYHIINDKRIKSELELVMPSSIQVLSHGLATAMSQNSIEFNKGVTNLVSKYAGKSNAALLAYNMVNAAMGISQIVAAIPEIKNPLYIARAMWDFITQRPSNGPVTRRNIDDASHFMRNRNAFRTKSIERQISKFDNKSLFSKVTGTLEEYSFVLQSAVQNMCDYIVWNAAYYNALDKKYSKGKVEYLKDGFDAAAVKQADATVRRSQLSKSNSDLSDYETKESIFANLLTPFSSVFISMINLSRVHNAAIDLNRANESWLARRARKAGVLLSVWIAPTMISEIIRSMASGDEVESDPVIVAMLSAMGYRIHPLIGGVVAVMSRLIANICFDAKEYVPAGIYSSPIETLISTNIRAMVKVFGGEGDEVRVTDATAALGIFVTGYTQLSRNINFITDYYNDELYETTTADLIRGFITGKASKEQKGE